MVSHQRFPPTSAKMQVIIVAAMARTDAAAMVDGPTVFCSTCCQVAAAWAHSGSTPVPDVQASPGKPTRADCSAAAPEWLNVTTIIGPSVGVRGCAADALDTGSPLPCWPLTRFSPRAPSPCRWSCRSDWRSLA